MPSRANVTTATIVVGLCVAAVICITQLASLHDDVDVEESEAGDMLVQTWQNEDVGSRTSMHIGNAACKLEHRAGIVACTKAFPPHKAVTKKVPAGNKAMQHARSLKLRKACEKQVSDKAMACKKTVSSKVSVKEKRLLNCGKSATSAHKICKHAASSAYHTCSKGLAKKNLGSAYKKCLAKSAAGAHVCKSSVTRSQYVCKLKALGIRMPKKEHEEAIEALTQVPTALSAHAARRVTRAARQAFNELHSANSKPDAKQDGDWVCQAARRFVGRHGKHMGGLRHMSSEDRAIMRSLARCTGHRSSLLLTDSSPLKTQPDQRRCARIARLGIARRFAAEAEGLRKTRDTVCKPQVQKQPGRRLDIEEMLLALPGSTMPTKTKAPSVKLSKASSAKIAADITHKLQGAKAYPKKRSGQKNKKASKKNATPKVKPGPNKAPHSKALAEGTPAAKPKEKKKKKKKVGRKKANGSDDLKTGLAPLLRPSKNPPAPLPARPSKNPPAPLPASAAPTAAATAGSAATTPPGPQSTAAASAAASTAGSKAPAATGAPSNGQSSYAAREQALAARAEIKAQREAEQALKMGEEARAHGTKTMKSREAKQPTAPTAAKKMAAISIDSSGVVRNTLAAHHMAITVTLLRAMGVHVRSASRCVATARRVGALEAHMSWLKTAVKKAGCESLVERP
jgi:hypothetical protein